MPPETWAETGWCACGGDHAYTECPACVCVRALEPDRVDDPTCWSCGRSLGACLCDGRPDEF